MTSPLATATPAPTSAAVGRSATSTLRRVLTIARLELRKVLVTRGSAVLLIVTLGVGTLLGLGALILATRLDLGVIQASVPLATLSLAVAIGAPLIGVLIMTSDWQSRETMTTFLLEPRRTLVFWGKLVATAGLALALTITVAVLSLIMAVIVAVVTGRGLGMAETGPALGMLIVICLVGSVSGSALAAMIMNTPLAIVIVVLQPLVIDTALGFVPGVGSYLQAAAFSNFLVGEGSPLPALSSLLLWIVLPLVLGNLRWRRAEVR